MSEPPHIRNWFPSYETPALDNDNDDFEESVVKESASEDGFAIKGSNKDTEENFQESRNSGNSNEVGAGEKLYPNGFVKCKSSFGDVDENKSLCKVLLLDTSSALMVFCKIMNVFFLCHTQHNHTFYFFHLCHHNEQ